MTRDTRRWGVVTDASPSSPVSPPIDDARLLREDDALRYRRRAPPCTSTCDDSGDEAYAEVREAVALDVVGRAVAVAVVVVVDGTRAPVLLLWLAATPMPFDRLGCSGGREVPLLAAAPAGDFGFFPAELGGPVAAGAAAAAKFARGDWGGCDEVVEPTLVDRIFRVEETRPSPLPASPSTPPLPLPAATHVDDEDVDGTIKCNFVGDFKSPIEARVT